MKCFLIIRLERRLLLFTTTKIIRIFKLIKCILNGKDTNIIFYQDKTILIRYGNTLILLLQI